MAFIHKRLADIDQYFSQQEAGGKPFTQDEFENMVAAKFGFSAKITKKYVTELYRLRNRTPAEREKIIADNMAEIEKIFGKT